MPSQVVSSTIPVLRTASGFRNFSAFMCQIVETQNYAAFPSAMSESENNVDDPDDSDDSDDSDNETMKNEGEHVPRPLNEHTFFPFDDDVTKHKVAPPNVVDDPTLPADEYSLLEWHYRLNHASFDQIKYLATLGILPKKLQDCRTPKCPACIYGKATKRAWRTKGSTKINPPRVAKAPGECVSVDTLESPTPGLVAQAKGTLTKGRYNYATVFVDQYSGLDYVHVHRENSGDKTLEAKLAFEQFASTHGVLIKHYHADNGRFAEAKFMQACQDSTQQGLTFCGVNAHHQNGRAERRIRHLTESARTMILHAAHRWPKVITAHLWPYAIRLASDIGHNVPRDSKEGEKRVKPQYNCFLNSP